MPVLSSSLDIASPRELVWDLISKFEHWPSWGVTVIAVEPSTGRLRTGVTGRIETIAGLWLPFEITDVVSGEWWTWEVAGVPATGHRVESTERGCRLTLTVPVWAPFYLPVVKRALHKIEQASTRQ